MKVENLRSLIRESINEYIREIDNAGTKAGLEAKVTATEEAISKREKMANMEGIDEAYHDMLDKGKMKEIGGEVKALKKSLDKLKKQLDKLNSKSEPKAEVIKDEPVDESYVEEDAMDSMDNAIDPKIDYTMEEVELSDKEKEELRKKAETNNKEYNIMNESFLKMQKMAGVITESQYNQKIKLLNEEVTVGGTYTASMPTSSDGKERIDVKVKVLGKDRSNEDKFIVTPLEDKDYTNAASGQQNRFEKGKQYGVEAEFIK